MFCSKCGDENPENAGFCKKCGVPLKSTSKLIEEGSATGLEPNVAGLLCYVLGWMTGLAFYVIEKEDRFVRFHAVQSIIVSIVAVIVCIPVAIVAIIFALITPILGNFLWGMFCLAGLVLTLFLMYKAYLGEKYMLPKVGEIAEKYI